MRNALYIIYVLLLSSCASQQKQADRAYRFFRQNPTNLAKLCADQYPVKEQWIAGKEIIQIDTIRLADEKVPCPTLGNQKTAFIRCPGAKTIVQKIHRTDTLFRENTARITDISNQLNETKMELAITKRRTKLLSLICATVCLLGVCWIWLKS
ncbi:MAG: hypothetical protein U0X71_04735 [Sphingobacteriaceae bacterium]